MDPFKTKSRSAMRRQREKEMRYRTILEAAESLFARQGYQQTSIEQVADSAEVSVGTVYFYFKKKEEILINLMEDIGFQLRKLLGTEFRRAEASPEGLKNAGLAFFNSFCLNFPEKVSIFYRESVGQSVEVERQRKKLHMQITADIEGALIRIREGQKIRYHDDDLSPELMAVCIVGIYERVACHYLLWKDSPKSDIMKLAQGAVSFTLGGVDSLIVKKEYSE
ncbi:MAG: TetR/AcrR family transcriptional regulator [Desulfobacterales bacterium]|nr:TetR/AcrR family transcriptional regulator [Desulfobacterales bacterium]